MAGCGDLCVVVRDSGSTLDACVLRVLDRLAQTDLSVVFSQATYAKYPRLLREIKNALEHETIYFYTVAGPDGFLSNFYPCHFVDEQGLTWRSSEAYYQAHCKFTDEQRDLREKVRLAPTANKCYKITYRHREHFRRDYERVRDDVMWRALRLKFDQNVHLAQRLVDTGKKRLVEHALRDAHFGCGIDGHGENVLGHMLTRLRADFQGKPRDPVVIPSRL